VNRIDAFLSSLPPAYVLTMCLALVAIIGATDYFSGYEMNVTVLYLTPILMTAWALGAHAAIVMSIIATAAWYLSILYMHQSYSQPWLHIWDGFIQFAMFVVFGIVIAKLKTALGHADERFATVLEGLDAAVYVSDAETGEVVYANEQFRKTFPPAASPPSVPIGVNQGEFHDALRGRWYLVHSRPMRWIDGRPVRLQLATDISERRRTEALFRQQQEKIQMTARLVTVGEMATTLAHELNQPLAAITNYSMGCVRRLRSGDWKEAELLEALEKGAAQAERASKVLQRVRSFVSRRAPNLVPCDINEVIGGVASMISVEARARGASVTLELSDAIAYVHADPVLMEQVILNFARNAVEAMEDAPPDQRHVHIRSRSAGEASVEIEIADRGRGIDPQLEANLFTPFFSTKPHGTGLGLHICRSIVEAHGGRVWLTRNADQGVTFHFSLRTVYA
jgi:C4-dicarboxylate-specific signal transduction histidine kinase